MVAPADYRVLTEVYHKTGKRVRLRDYESIANYQVNDKGIALVIETYEVKIMAREDRYLAKGMRVMFWLTNSSGSLYLATDSITWDEDFEPFVYEKFGRRKTADEFHEQREWEKLCYRPGTTRSPLDSYERVCDPFTKSTTRMERHF